MTRHEMGEALDRGLASTEPNFRLSVNDAVWSLNPSSAVHVHRFNNFLAILPRHWISVTPGTRVLLCAIAYEGILSIGDLLAFAQATSDRQRLPGGSRVTWTSQNSGLSRIEARYISARTELALDMVGDIGNWSAAMDAAGLFFTTHYSRLGDWDTKQPIQIALLDASAWLYLHLPSCLYSHLRGAIIMPLMAESVFGRLTHPPAASVQLVNTLTDTDCLIDLANEQAMNNILDLPSSVAPSFPEKTISLLKSICSPSANESGIRLANHLHKASTKDKLILLNEIISREGWVAATLAAWTTFLLNYGSIRKSNPAMSTISAYLNDLLAPLATELLKMDKTPGILLQRDWALIFDNLAKAEGAMQRGAALASLHLWAVRCFGCEPMPHVLFTREAPTQVHANLVWPHEQALAIEMASSISTDERTCNQCMVLLALGCKGLFRIGELPSLTTRNVRETPDGLHIDIDPGHGTHGGKSRAARRIVVVHDPEAARLVVAWRDRRNRESRFLQTDSVFLFGDPNQAHKLYRFGHCVRLINSLLKTGTGDDSVSFHSLRHGSATYRACRLLSSDFGPSAVSPLHALLHEIGHATDTTIWTTYFHLPEFAIRRAIDSVDIVRQINSHEAAFWLAKSTMALRKKRSLAASADDSNFYGSLVANKAFMKHPDGHIPGHPYTLPPIQTLAPTSDAPITLLWVREALATVVARFDKTAACWRLSCTEAQLKQVCLSVQEVLLTINTNRNKRPKSLLLEAATTEHALDWAHNNLAARCWSFELADTSHLQYLSKYLCAHGQQKIGINGAKSWVAMRYHDTLSLDDTVASRAFLSLLREAGFPPQAIVARVQKQSSGDVTHELAMHLATEIKTINELTLETLGTDIRIEDVEPRRGYPRRYLMLGRSKFAPDKPVPSASLCMAEIHGLFFALNVFLQLKLRGLQ